MCFCKWDGELVGDLKLVAISELEKGKRKKAKMRVSTCCCGCSLEQGCKIIAILGLIVGGLNLISSVASGSHLVVELQVAAIIGSILALVVYSLLLWGTLYV